MNSASVVLNVHVSLPGVSVVSVTLVINVKFDSVVIIVSRYRYVNQFSSKVVG